MPQDNREDISLDFAFISLIAEKINVIIIGGGKAGYIKAKSFLQKGYNVAVVSKEFDERFESRDKGIVLIEDEYKEKYILDKHLVIIATDDNDINRKIRNDCEKHFKVYLNSCNFKDGQFITPVEIKGNNIKVGIHTRVASPKTSKFLAEKIKETTDEYDDFVGFIGSLRSRILQETENRDLNLEIMNFVNSDDFYYFYKKDVHELILKLF